MSDLFWPGDHRAGSLFTASTLVAAMCRVESAWLSALVQTGIAEPAARDDLDELLAPGDLRSIAVESEAGANPVIPLVALLRQRVRPRNAAASKWLHNGLTSQDVLDTALMLCAVDLVSTVRRQLDDQIVALCELIDEHRMTLMTGRTLTQHAVPITFALKAAQWLSGLLDATDDLTRLTTPAQFGGAAGTLAATAHLAAEAGLVDPAARAREVADQAAQALGLELNIPWHTARAPITRLGNGLVGCSDAWGRIAADVLTLSRPEIAELSEGTGGGSSTMPHKANPVLSVLLRRAALAGPALGAALHLAAADARDERPDGAWHLEWSALRDLARHTATAAHQATELLHGLAVHGDRMQAAAIAASDALLAERRSLTKAAQQAHPPSPGTGQPDSQLSDYLGATSLIIDAALDRARSHLKEPR